MGSFGTNAFDNDGALDFVGDLAELGPVTLPALIEAAEACFDRDEAVVAAAEIAAAALSPDWSAYRVGNPEWLVAGGYGQPTPEGTVVLTEDAAAVALGVRRAHSDAGGGAPEALAAASGLLAAVRELSAADSGPGSDWRDPAARGRALDALSGRLRDAIVLISSVKLP